jgi:pyridoxine 4-dehydrogenase
MNLGRMASKSIVNKAVGPVGYGMLGLTVPWAPLEHEVAASLLKRALERGANLWNTVCFHCSVYGSPNFG